MFRNQEGVAALVSQLAGSVAVITHGRSALGSPLNSDNNGPIDGVMKREVPWLPDAGAPAPHPFARDIGAAILAYCTSSLVPVPSYSDLPPSER